MDKARTQGRRTGGAGNTTKRNSPTGGPRGRSAQAAKFGRSPKASARPAFGRRSKQPAGKAAALAGMARGAMPKGAAPASKKGPAALAMAAAGGLAGVVLARRRKGGATEGQQGPDTTLHVSSEPAEVVGNGPAPGAGTVPQGSPPSG